MMIKEKKEGFWAVYGADAMAVYKNKWEAINNVRYANKGRMKWCDTFADAVACAIEGYNEIQTEAQHFDDMYHKLTLPRNRMLFRSDVRSENFKQKSRREI